ncbi:unnamed protein product [Clonostachys solani]|uniref:beta-glucosidase n=1 Tax=Clonostachys solani TaxID=160281 RepID=A0A9P0ESG6_9HYPO|nr:unnamed protein product [Clonostachys solani]
MSIKISYEVAPGNIRDQELSLNQAIGLLSGKDFWRTRDFPELQLGALKFTDGPNGARGENWTEGKAAVCFPCATALGASFDRNLLREVGSAIAVDARGKRANGLLAPTVNIHRYILNGRNFESYSEDPHLSGFLAAEYINGVQSQNIAASPKHFLGNEVENGRRWSDSVIDERALREIYLEPFRLLCKHSSPLCLMTAYNAVNGEYCSESPTLLRIVRDEWNYDGVIISDWFGTYSTSEAINAGLDLELPGETKFRTQQKMTEAIERGQIDPAHLTTILQRVVELLQKTGRIGLSDAEDARGTLPELSSVPNAETSALLRRAAADGMVLLKNKNNTLPLSASAGDNIAVVGKPAAEPSIFGGGSASLKPAHISTPLGALCQTYPSLAYSEGVAVQRLVDLSCQIKVPESDVRLEWFNSSEPDEKQLFRDEVVPKSEYMMMEDIHAGLADLRSFCTLMTVVIQPPVTGAYRLSLTSPGSQTCYIDGKVVGTVARGAEVVTEDYIFNRARLEQRIDTPIHLESSKQYTLTIVTQSAKHSPVHINREFYVQGSRVGLAPIPDDDKDIADAAAKVSASGAAATVVFVGTSTQWESEGFDRVSYSLPLRQNDLIRAVAKASPGPTIVVVNAGSAVDCTPWIDEVDAVIQAWFPGQEYGSAISDVLTGRVSPSARLPTTIPRSMEGTCTGDLTGKTEGDKGVQKRIVYQESWAVGYRAFGGNRDWYNPLFAFGHGLSYSEFSYGAIKQELIHGDDDISVALSVPVKNTGDVEAAEVVQLYVQPPQGSVERPIVELRAFAKTQRLASGEEQTVQLQLSKEAFSFWDVETHSWKVEAGEYTVLFAGSAGVGDWIETGERVSITVDKTFHWSA